jgi:hypothetical protein
MQNPFRRLELVKGSSGELASSSAEEKKGTLSIMQRISSRRES